MKLYITTRRCLLGALFLLVVGTTATSGLASKTPLLVVFGALGAICGIFLHPVLERDSVSIVRLFVHAVVFSAVGYLLAEALSHYRINNTVASLIFAGFAVCVIFGFLVGGTVKKFMVRE